MFSLQETQRLDALKWHGRTKTDLQEQLCHLLAATVHSLETEAGLGQGPAEGDPGTAEEALPACWVLPTAEAQTSGSAPAPTHPHLKTSL